MSAPESDRDSPEEPNPRTRPEHALSPGLLARVFHQPALIYFNAVAKHLSVREAARQLNVASSAVTRQVAHLEDALGIALFHREKRRLRLSPAGEILYRHAQRLTAPMEAAVSELEMLRGIRTGRVRIATVESVGLPFLPRLVTEFGIAYPRLHLEVSVATSAAVVDRVANEQADIGFGFVAGTPENIDVTFRRDVRIGVVMRPDHPLASEPNLTLSTCLNHPLAIPQPPISIRQVIDPFLRQAATHMPPMVEVDSIRMLVELARGGHHAAIMTPIGAQNEIAEKSLVFRPLEDRDLPTNRFGILVRNVSGLQFAPAVFYEHARNHFEKLDLPGTV